jgi:catechol 2,3-dioxygenase-like lactoylglutathione lyase family enzyme
VQLLLELFVDDLQRSRDFFTGVLGFEVRAEQASGYTSLSNGDALISLNDRKLLGDDHPIQAHAGERLGRGIEIVLSVADIDAAFEKVTASGWPDVSELGERPWGLRDFRLADPDGYYLRISSMRT